MDFVYITYTKDKIFLHENCISCLFYGDVDKLIFNHPRILKRPVIIYKIRVMNLNELDVIFCILDTGL